MAKAGNDSISGGSGGVSADMFEFGSGHIGGICDGSFTAGSGSGVSGKVSGTSSSNFVSVKSWEGRNDTVGSSGGSVGAVMLNFSGPNFGTVGNRSSSTSGSSVSGHVRSPCGGYFRRLLCRWLESGIREVEVRIVVPSSWVLLSGCKANDTQKHCENLIRKIQMVSRLKLSEREGVKTYVDLHVDSPKRLSAGGIRSGINENLRDTRAFIYHS
jgi:hypothetical protein